MGGALIKQRAYVKFTGLSAIPRNAKIVSATLYLYGLSSSLNSPQGNSGYLGSPYSSQNACYLFQVTSPWDETTITWNKQPSFATNNSMIIPPTTTQWNDDAITDVTKMVRVMVRNPALNQGFVIALVNEAIYRSVIYGTSESAEVDRPRLVVEYQL